MSLAVDATVLILLQTKPLRWWGAAELANRMQVPDQVITDSLHRLQAAGSVQVVRVAGLPFKAAVIPKPAPPQDLADQARERGTAPDVIGAHS